MYQNLVSKKPKEYKTASEFLRDAVEYFQWCEANPILEDVLFHHKGAIVRTTKNHPRPFTKNGLATFIGIPVSRLALYRDRVDDPQWSDAIDMITQVMHDQKFTGAVAGVMNTTMIKSDLGMVDRNELSGPNGGALRVLDTNAEEALYDEARRLGIDIEALGFGGSSPKE